MITTMQIWFGFYIEQLKSAGQCELRNGILNPEMCELQADYMKHVIKNVQK